MAGSLRGAAGRGAEARSFAAGGRTAVRKAPRRFSRARIAEDAHDLDHPFLRWFAAHHARGAGECREARGGGLDFLMGPVASTRFSLGVDTADGSVALGVGLPDGQDALSVGWTHAAFLRRVAGGDWVVLATPDLRLAPGDPPGGESIGARLWLPATSGLLDAWAAEGAPRPDRLRLVGARIERRAPAHDGGADLGSLDLAFKGRWKPDGPPTDPGG